MEILFLTLENFSSYSDHDMYADVMNVFVEHGHKVHTVAPAYKTGKTTLYKEGESSILRVCTDSTTGSNNLIKKGLSTLLIGSVFKSAIKKYYVDKRFDLVIYSTPPITFVGPIRYIRRKHGAKTYLMLKDIFPQNAVDLGMFSKVGIKSLLFFYFRWKEKQLYRQSDYIGCMSQANVEYLLKHNPEIPAHKVGICANSLRVPEQQGVDRGAVRKQYGLPLDKTVFVYGGNLGKPQGVEHIIACLNAAESVEDAFFVIVGGGTEYERLKQEFANADHVKIMASLPVDEYHTLAAACDVGLIFLDHRFTIPNFPSRLLSYTQAAMPVFSVTDENTDIGTVISENGFGWACTSYRVDDFCDVLLHITQQENLQAYGARGQAYHKKHWLPEHSYNAVMEALSK